VAKISLLGKEEGEKKELVKKEDIKNKLLSTIRTSYPQKRGSYPQIYVNVQGKCSFTWI
jgi:hypothetical protein